VSTVAPSAALTAPRLARAGLALRAALLLALGLLVTFVADHSAPFGQLVFGVAALALTAPAVLDAVLRRRAGIPWGLSAVRAGVGLVAGVVALVLLPASGVGLLVALLSGWALVAGGAELVEGVLDRRHGRGGEARDAILVGAITVVLAIVLLVIPPDFTEPWRVVSTAGEVEAEGAVTTSIMAVGLLGAWAIVTGVLLAISALGPRGSAA